MSPVGTACMCACDVTNMLAHRTVTHRRMYLLFLTFVLKSVLFLGFLDRGYEIGFSLIINIVMYMLIIYRIVSVASPTCKKGIKNYI